MTNKLLITVISGFENSGKTSVLLDLLRNRDSREAPAVIMNDLSEMVSSADIVREALEEDHHSLLELRNGCICCSLKDVFLHAVDQIVGSSVDHLYIEGNATAEPTLIRMFLEESECSNRICMDNMITVIDASTFFRDYLSTDELRHRGLVALEHDDRIVSEVLADQIECADTLVITKCDLVSDTDVIFLHSALSTLNPKAKIVYRGRELHTADNSSISSFRFKSDKPFHPQRLHHLLTTNLFNSVLRAKGTVWIASRPDYQVRWSQTGSVCALEPDGAWWHLGCSSKEERFHQQWFNSCGSRYTEIEFIGSDLDADFLHTLLSDCLLTYVEMQLGPELWLHLEDPFEEWEDEMDRSLFVVRDLLPSGVGVS